jgi:hypothetical protein
VTAGRNCGSAGAADFFAGLLAALLAAFLCRKFAVRTVLPQRTLIAALGLLIHTARRPADGQRSRLLPGGKTRYNSSF